MSIVLALGNGSTTTITTNSVTLEVNAQGRWVHPSTAQFVTGIKSTLAQGESLVLTLEKASSTVPGLKYSLSGSGWQGQALSGGAYRLTIAQPSVLEVDFSVTAESPTPPAPTGLSIKVKRQSVPISLAHESEPASFFA